MGIVGALVSSAVVGVLVGASISKLLWDKGLVSLSHSLARTVPLVARMAVPTARVLVAIELILGIGVAIPFTRAWALAGAALLLITMGAVLTAGKLSNNAMTCACFGAAERPITAVHLARNVALGLMAAVVVLFEPLPEPAGSTVLIPIVGGLFVLVMLAVEAVQQVTIPTKGRPAL